MPSPEVQGSSWGPLLYSVCLLPRGSLYSDSLVSTLQLQYIPYQGQDSRLIMRTFLKPASLGYGVNKQYSGVWGGKRRERGAD